ncbi:RSP_7527 family protein [Pukyongiella litopenaei]|uniref:RSP_7527 family protein n=1 Tax=Pukyongiella litopenaei TaxID=2605946 RepID=UPI001B8037C5|nr:hypothetical protein [Pukyongiella litopenaei]
MAIQTQRFPNQREVQAYIDEARRQRAEYIQELLRSVFRRSAQSIDKAMPRRFSRA